MQRFSLIAPRDLGSVPALAVAAFVAFAVFAWTERTVLVDPEGLSVSYWPWKLWHIGPLAIGLGGGWWLWLSTRRVPWVRSLALGVLALVVLANAYIDLFGDHWGNVWRTVNPLFIGASTVAGVAVRMHVWAGSCSYFAGIGLPGICQRLLHQQWNHLANAGPGTDARLFGLGRRSLCE